MTETAVTARTLYATVQQIPPDHRGGYTLGRDELVVEDVDYDQALEAARRRSRTGGGSSRCGSSASQCLRLDRRHPSCAPR